MSTTTKSCSQDIIQPFALEPKCLSEEILQFEQLLSRDDVDISDDLSELLLEITQQLRNPALMVRNVIDLYPLHTKLLKISELIRELDHPEISKGWLSLLNTLANHEFLHRFGWKIKPWMDRIISYFNTGQRDEGVIEELDPGSISLSTVREISEVAFTAFGRREDEGKLKAMLNAASNVCVVARGSQGKLLGYAYGFTGEITPGHRAFHLDMMARTPDASELGIGTRLIEKIENIVKERFEGGIKTINLNTHNEPAKRLYRQCGYEEVGPCGQEMFMVKKLDPDAVLPTPIDVLLFKTQGLGLLFPQQVAQQSRVFTCCYSRLNMVAILAGVIGSCGRVAYMRVGDRMGWNAYFDFSK